MSIFSSPLARIGIGAMTGGIGGAALGALSSSKSPAGRAAGMYQTGSNLYNNFGSQEPINPNYGSGQMPGYDQNAFGGDTYANQFDAMNRRLKSNFGGGY